MVFFPNYPNFWVTNMSPHYYQNSRGWLIFSLGPDQKYCILTPTYPSPFVDYDPTNGTISFGDVMRFNS